VDTATRRDDFVASHRRFWMYSFGTPYVERSLIGRGARLVECARDRPEEGALYQVFMEK
jgi:hypothetical protein